VKAERELERRLADLPMPGDAEAEERSWEVVRAAYADRTPVRPTYRARRFALAATAGAVLLAIGLSPAGAKVGDWVHDVVGAEDAKPELKTLPAAGELLVEGGDGIWMVRDDGSKARLGDYDEATWSPNGLYAAVTDGDRLLAVDPEGEVRWEITAPAPVHDPRWAGTEFDTRIAYRSGDDLWVVAGDGTGERIVARDVLPIAPAWRPLGDTKLAPPGANVLSYVDGEGEIRAVDVDTGQNVPVEGLGAVPELTPSTVEGRARSPITGRTAAIRRSSSGSNLALLGDGPAPRELLLRSPGYLTGPTWSPDGRWILIGWRDADQWLFINADQPRRVVAFDNIAEQFGESGAPRRRFPRVAGWVLPEGR
jgi:WD40-like Beta Propeller Repeat